ncbi:rho guanine nucleotide exchange factor 39 isoform X2 [Pleurodeles waltl]|uniref:rho guanine nucleotide exchange factor 39 isoform X2 n=1 Tax=Pleurodeles waltl TaxID=8319 RepID=UPI003709B519
MPWTCSQGPHAQSLVNACARPTAPTAMSAHVDHAGAISTVEEQRARWQRKRVRTAEELVETERKYVEQLGLVTTYFVEILKAKGTLRQDIRESIFGPIKSIYQANEALLQSLDGGQFGDGFEDFCLHLDLYKRYTDGLEQASKVLQVQVKKNKSFARFKRLQEGRPDFQGLKLEELLPLPLQRVLHYKHLLRDLTENTSPDTLEFQQLTRAVRAVSEVAQYIHDNARSHENYLQVVRVQKLLKGRKTKVLVPGRVYIREGWLTTVPQKGEEMKHKMFFLFSDILLMTKPCHPLHPVNSDKFCCQSLYPLEECAVEKVFGHTKSQGGLISLSFEREKLLLMSTDQDDINDWFRCLSSAIGQLKAQHTIVQRKENLRKEPKHIAQATTSGERFNPPGERKRNLNKDALHDQGVSHPVPCQPWCPSVSEETLPKKAKLCEINNPTLRFQGDTGAPAPSSGDKTGGSCVIL